MLFILTHLLSWLGGLSGYLPRVCSLRCITDLSWIRHPLWTWILNPFKFLSWLHIWKVFQGVFTRNSLRWIWPCRLLDIFFENKTQASSSGERETRAFKSRWRVAQTGWFEDFGSMMDSGFFEKTFGQMLLYDTIAQRNVKLGFLFLENKGQNLWQILDGVSCS